MKQGVLTIPGDFWHEKSDNESEAIIPFLCDVFIRLLLLLVLLIKSFI